MIYICTKINHKGMPLSSDMPFTNLQSVFYSIHHMVTRKGTLKSVTNPWYMLKAT